MRVFQTIAFLLIFSIVATGAGPINGDWSGVIKVANMDLRLAFHVTESDKGLQATFDSIDQKVLGMPVEKIEVKGQQVKFEIGVIQAVYTGTLDKAGTTITGSWSQVGQVIPVKFQKTAQAKK